MLGIPTTALRGGLVAVWLLMTACSGSAPSVTEPVEAGGEGLSVLVLSNRADMILSLIHISEPTRPY